MENKNENFTFTFYVKPPCPFSLPPSEGDSRASDSILYYHGTGTKILASGERSQSLVSMVVRFTEDSMYVIYRILNNESDTRQIVQLKDYINRDCTTDSNGGISCPSAPPAPDFIKVYVPSGGQSLTSIDEHNITSLNMVEAGWGHRHWHRGSHGYTKLSYFLNYNYPGIGHIDSNYFVKIYDDGSRRMFGKVGVVSDEGVHVWTDKMKLVFTAP